METLIRRRVLRRLIWVCTVCQLPFYGSPDYNRLSAGPAPALQQKMFPLTVPKCFLCSSYSFFVCRSFELYCCILSSLVPLHFIGKAVLRDCSLSWVISFMYLLCRHVMQIASVILKKIRLTFHSRNIKPYFV